MSNALHTKTNCQAQAEGICERLHVGDVVKVTTYGASADQLGAGQFGTVVANAYSDVFEVNFPDGVLYPDGLLHEGNLFYSECELEKMSV